MGGGASHASSPVVWQYTPPRTRLQQKLHDGRLYRVSLSIHKAHTRRAFAYIRAKGLTRLGWRNGTMPNGPPLVACDVFCTEKQTRRLFGVDGRVEKEFSWLESTGVYC